MFAHDLHRRFHLALTRLLALLNFLSDFLKEVWILLNHAQNLLLLSLRHALHLRFESLFDKEVLNLAHRVALYIIPLMVYNRTGTSLVLNKQLTFMVRTANPALLKPLNISPELEAVVGKGPMPRSQVVKKM